MTTTSKAGQPQGEGVLAGLDSQPTTSFYWYLAVLSCIGGFLFGYETADIGSALGFIPYHLSTFATGYLVAGASLGAAVGAIAAGPLTDRFGRKSLLIADAAIYAIGALLSGVAMNSAVCSSHARSSASRSEQTPRSPPHTSQSLLRGTGAAR